MASLSREASDTNADYFYHLYNDFGCTDLAFTIADKNGWSKWFRYDWLMHLAPDERFPLNDNPVSRTVSRNEFFEMANNRSVLDIELLLDIDSVLGSSDPEHIAQYSENLCKRLRKLNINFECWFSGSKSYHISILVPQLRDMNPTERKAYKSKILSIVGADLCKASEKNMIALEGVPHWKTGKKKVQIKNEFN